MRKRYVYRGLLCCSLAAPALVLAQNDRVETQSVDCDLSANRNRLECVSIDTGRTVDEVVVTGTYLKRDKFTSPSPIEVITLEDLEESGTASFGDFIRDLPFTLNSNTINNIIDTGGTGGDRQNGTDTSINLRGFGTDGTITLVNGVRAPTALDANGLIPEIAMQRAEILLDGGGALYGADAIAGVVNLISIKEYEGFRAKFYHVADDGRDYGDSKFSFLAGGKFGELDIVTSFEAQKRTALSNAERPEYMRQSIGASTTANPGRFNQPGLTIGSVSIPGAARQDPGCGAYIDGLNYSDPGKKGYAPTGIPVDSNGAPTTPGSQVNCALAYDEFQDYIPAMERYVSNTNFKYGLNESVELQYNLALQWRETTTRTSPHGGGSLTPLANMRIYNDHPGMPTEMQNQLTSSYVLASAFRPFGKLGTRPSSYNGDGSHNQNRETYTYNHTVTANYDLWDTGWTGTTYGSSSRRRDTREEYAISESRMRAALQGFGGPNCGFDTDALIGSFEDDPGYPFIPGSQSGAEKRQAVIAGAAQAPGQNGCGYFNPFSTALIDPTQMNDQELVDWLMEKARWNSGSSETRTWETRVHGDLFQLPAGPVSLAAGFNYRGLSYETGQSRIAARDDNINAAGNNFFFSETVRSQFAELAFPILHNLDMSAAVRRENYSDRPFGSVTKPKYSLSYRPTDDLVLRASYSESFTAPRADQMDSGSVTRFNLSSLTIDPFNNVNNGVPVASAHGGELVISGNPELLPEESETINLGFTYRGLQNWQFSMDVQEIKFFDRVVNIDREKLLERQYNKFIESGGDINNQADVLAFFAANPNPEIIRDPLDGGILAIYQRPSNADDITARFVDFKIENSTSSRWGSFRTSFSATGYERWLYQDEVTLEKFDAVGQRNRNVSAASAIPRWKGNLIVRWRNGNHNVVSRTDYVGGVKFDGNEINYGATPPSRIGSFTTTDLRYSYLMPDMYDGVMQWTIGSMNLFDKQAQKLPIAGGFESRLHDPYGRRIYMEVSYDF